MNMKFKSLIVAGLSVLLGTGVFGGMLIERPENTETIAATASSKASIQVWVYDEGKVGVNKLKISNFTFDSGYGFDDLLCWLNNYKGTCSNVHTNNTTATASDGVITVIQNNYATGTHYDRNGRHYNFVMPYFVSKLNFSLHRNSNDYQYVNGTFTSRVRKAFGVYDNSGGKGQWSLSGDSSINTSFTTNVVTKSINGVTSTVNRYQYTSITSIAGAGANGKNFAGWYNDSKFTTKYKSTDAITKDMTIYAKLVDNTYIYVAINGDQWEKGIYAYSWIDNSVEYPHGAWPGTKITTNAPDLEFVKINSLEYGLVRIPVYEGYGDKIIINNGNGNGYQTQTFKITIGAYYTQTDAADATGDTKDGAEAAAFAYDLNEARLAVTASGNILAQSICGLDANTWVDRYDALSEAAKTRVNAVKINTYTPDEKDSTTLKSKSAIKDIIDVLRTKYVNKDALKILFGNSHVEFNYTITILLVCLCLSGVGVFVIKKRKSLSK